MSEPKDAADAHIKKILLLSLMKDPIQWNKDEQEHINWLLSLQRSSCQTVVGHRGHQHNSEPGKGICSPNQPALTLDGEMKAYEMWTTHKVAGDFQRRAEIENDIQNMPKQ